MKRTFFAVALLVTFASASHEAQKRSEPDVCLDLFNDFRASLGAPPLTMHPALVAEAKRHLQEMKSHGSEYQAAFGTPIADFGWSDVEPPFGWAPFEPFVHMGLRACNDEWAASTSPYPCRASSLFDSIANEGRVAGVSAQGSREGRIMCSVNVWLSPRYPDWIAISNPTFVHVGIAKNGKVWSTFLGWPES